MTNRVDIDAAVAPLTIGPANCALVLGAPWRWVRDHARRLGVESITVGGKRLFPAAQLIEAFRRDGKLARQPVVLTDGDELAAMRARVRGAA